MSRVGKMPVQLPKGVQVNLEGDTISVKGAKGELKRKLAKGIKVTVDAEKIVVERESSETAVKALHGLSRVLLQNMVQGVSQGFSKKLELIGVGFKAEMKQKYIVLSLGFSHPIFFRPPEEVKVEIPTPTSVVISGIDRELVGSVAAKIRSFRQPEPYKGKGVKYENEQIRRKEGKTAAK